MESKPIEMWSTFKLLRCIVQHVLHPMRDPPTVIVYSMQQNVAYVYLQVSKVHERAHCITTA